MTVVLAGVGAATTVTATPRAALSRLASKLATVAMRLTDAAAWTAGEAATVGVVALVAIVIESLIDPA